MAFPSRNRLLSKSGVRLFCMSLMTAAIVNRLRPRAGLVVFFAGDFLEFIKSAVLSACVSCAAERGVQGKYIWKEQDIEDRHQVLTTGIKRLFCLGYRLWRRLQCHNRVGLKRGWQTCARVIKIRPELGLFRFKPK